MFRKPTPRPISGTVRRPAGPPAPTLPDPLQQIARQLSRIADALEAANRLRE